MLLQELTGIKRFYNLDMYQITKLLRRFGIEFIGAGKYGQVFTHKNWPYVVKIFENDPEYLSFIEYAIKHPNIHFPKISKRPLQIHAFHSRSPRHNTKLWVVKIEKLVPMHDKNLVKFIVTNLSNGAETYYRIHTLRDREHDEYSKRFPILLPNGTVEKGLGIVGLFQKYPWFESLCGAYLQIMLHVEGSPDIHGGNVMQRPDGTIVITDPTWEGSNPYKEYQEYVRLETDYYSQFENEPTISGPSYLHKDKIANKIATDFANNLNDDIPF